MDRERKGEKGCVNVEKGVKFGEQQQKKCEKGSWVPDRRSKNVGPQQRFSRSLSWGSTLRFEGSSRLWRGIATTLRETSRGLAFYTYCIITVRIHKCMGVFCM